MRALPGVVDAKADISTHEVRITVENGATAASLAEQLNAAGGQFRYAPK